MSDDKRRVLFIEIPLDGDHTVAREAVKDALRLLTQIGGRFPPADHRYDRVLRDDGGREVGWLYVRRRAR